MESSNEQSSPIAEHEHTTNGRENDADEPTDDEGHDDPDDQRDDKDDSAVDPAEIDNVTLLQVDGNVSFTSDSSNSSHHKISVHITNRDTIISPSVMFGPQNIHTVKRSNKLAQTLHLPKICNINPQSVYNKQDEFISFVE